MFCRDLFFAANTFANAEVTLRSGSSLAEILEESGNRRERLSLAQEQELNETAECKIIGLTLETRPDKINVNEVRRLRLLGCTRVQIGVQHTDDR